MLVLVSRHTPAAANGSWPPCAMYGYKEWPAHCSPSEDHLQVSEFIPHTCSLNVFDTSAVKAAPIHTFPKSSLPRPFTSSSTLSSSSCDYRLHRFTREHGKEVMHTWAGEPRQTWFFIEPREVRDIHKMFPLSTRFAAWGIMTSRQTSQYASFYEKQQVSIFYCNSILSQRPPNSRECILIK